MAKLASLVVDLQLQSAQLRQGLDEANRKLEEFAKQSQRAGNLVAGAFAFDQLKDGALKLAAFVKGGADMADAMGELADAVGVPVEELSKLSYAAAFSGSSTEAVGKALSKTAALMAKALEPTSEQAAMFDALGVSATDADGKLRATEAVFGDIAERFAETEDGAGKTALAVKLFGEEGAKLIPLLNNGKAGLAAFGEEAARTGNVITEKGAASAGQFNDALDRLKKAGEGLALSVAQNLAPSMAALAEEITTSKSSAEAFEAVASALGVTMRVLASAAVAVATTFDVVGKAAAGAAAWTAALFDDDATASQSGEAAAAAGAAIMESLESESRKFRAIWAKSGPGAAMAADGEKAKPAADEYVAAIDRTKKAAERAADAQRKLGEEARKAAEASAKAMDEAVKSALALERQHAAIDQAVEKRRTDASPTEGFTDFEDALSRMAAAQKAAATLRERASTREKEGDILGADRATRRADELTELAERASGAADAFRELEKAAQDAAARAMDEQAAARVALEQAFDDIDRMVEQRRTGGDTSVPAFDDFNTALDAMATALKEEATLRSEAAALEREGRLGEARQALLAAEATRALAEHASAAADALERMPGDLLGMLAPSGPAISAMTQGATTGASAGAEGAVIGALVGLLSQSEAFQGALDELEAVFQGLADSLGSLIEPLLPIITVVAEVAGGLGALLEALSPIVEFVARPLFEVLKHFGIVVLGLVRMVGEIINSFVQAFGGRGFDLSGIDKALGRLENASYEAAREQQKVADAARATSEATANVPGWWKVEAARFAATDPGERGGGAPPVVVNDNSTTNINVPDADDPKAVAEMIIDMLEERNDRTTGTRFGGESQWAP